MLICSNFHDYYDHIVAFGVDKTIVFKRNSKDIWVKEAQELPGDNNFRNKDWNFKVYYRVIGFCGKIYPFITVKRWASPDSPEATGIKHFLFSVNDVKEFLKKFDLKTAKSDMYWGRKKNYSLRDISSITDFFKSNEYDFLKSYFAKFQVPSFIWTDTKGYMDVKIEITLNPRLKDFNFVRAVDPVTAFQELMNYISGVLGVSTRPMVKLSDKEMAKKRGHDGSYSFKKTPSKQSKPKRPKNR